MRSFFSLIYVVFILWVCPPLSFAFFFQPSTFSVRSSAFPVRFLLYVILPSVFAFIIDHPLVFCSAFSYFFALFLQISILTTVISTVFGLLSTSTLYVSVRRMSSIYD